MDRQYELLMFAHLRREYEVRICEFAAICVMCISVHRLLAAVPAPDILMESVQGSAPQAG